jgi:hypothetical protein
MPHEDTDDEIKAHLIERGVLPRPSRSRAVLAMRMTAKQIWAALISIAVLVGAGAKFVAADWVTGLLANIHAVPALRADIEKVKAVQEQQEQQLDRIDRNVQALVEHELGKRRRSQVSTENDK